MHDDHRRDLSVERKVYWRLVGSGEHPTNNADFIDPSDWVIFEPGETTKVFGFWVTNDIALEPDETFIVTAFDPVSQSNYGTPAGGTILTDDTSFAIMALTPSLREGTGSVGGTEYLFEVIRSGELSQTQILPWRVKADSALAPDFVAGVLPQGAVTFAPGETSKTIAVWAAADSLTESNEQFFVQIPEMTWAPFNAGASAVILNDDATVELRRIEASNQPEGDTGTTEVGFELLVSGDTSIARHVSWMVTPSRESLGSHSVDAADFPGGVFPTGTVTLAPGETRKIFSIPVAGDTIAETSEGFDIVLFDPSPGLVVSYGMSWGCIIKDDPLPVVAHDDAYVTTEGHWVTSFWMQAPSVLGNDIGATAVSLDAGPSHGTVELDANGEFTYKPDAGFHGIDSFTYLATGPDGADEGRVTLHVVPVIEGKTTTLNLLALAPEEQIAATYVAFVGRAADADGFEFWVDQFHGSLLAQGAKALLGNIASSFAISEEAKGLYSFLADPGNASDSQIGSFLAGVYRNPFNRSTDQGGLDYWTAQVRQKLVGGEFVGSVLVDIISGTQAVTNPQFFYNDLRTLMGKVAVSLEFVRAQQEHGMAWNCPADTAAAFNLLKDVYSDPGSVLVGIKHGDDYVAAHG